MNKYLKALGALVLFIGLGIAGQTLNAPESTPAEQPTSESTLEVSQEPMLGASIPTVVSRFETSLQSSISDSATSMTLVSGTDRAGNALSGYHCFTLDEGTNVAEDVCGTASSTAVTSLTRGISPVTGTSSVSSLKFAHRRGASVKITDYPQLAVLSRILNGSETIPNQLRYDTSVSTTSMASNLQNVASVAYVNGIAVSGASDASTIVKGLVEAGTAAEILSGTASGATGALLFAPGSLYNATSSATTIIPVTKANGKLSQGFFDLTENFTWTGAHTFNTATTTIAATTTAPLVVRGVNYVFPASQGAATTTLLNNGSGSLSWVNMPYVNGFGETQASSTLPNNTDVQVSTDGFAFVMASGGSGATNVNISIGTSTSTYTTICNNAPAGTPGNVTCFAPVKRNNWVKVSGGGAGGWIFESYWIPIQ